ncbi:hypothetical protein SAMD00019534_124300 [Acytostelium subglobosum LB1]|uniref:hypothetical protein n=1 Tax=Acytostelium subglobosum LB1 TaxID=1410327 RepID=UPI000644CF34|nr:hypothetical protein SAMD00019534_124300 [Acytostelium subglobosum LB1]GAM29254.1 hypothetical protein SAMD00019534_124300 [Acytostelium subglobosum LB1]|eukprot:XP_012747828.1 hypothetical protein SAMD00019534_124300 [Acytostelium subglobosum LB1]
MSMDNRVSGSGSNNTSTSTSTSTAVHNQLGELIVEALHRHSYTTAIYYADKLLQLSLVAPPNVYSENLYMLCNCLFSDGQYKRCTYLLQQFMRQKTSGVQRKHIYLAARSKFRLGEGDYEQCIQILGEDDESMYRQYNIVEDTPTTTTNNNTIQMSSMMSMLRGKIYEAMDNQKKSKYWYIKSLKQDYKNYEAFEALINGHILNYSEELELIALLNFSRSDKWLQELYLTSLKKYESPNNNNNNNNSIISRFLRMDCGDETLSQTLAQSNDCRSSLAEYYFYQYHYREAYDITNSIFKEDKYYNNQTCLLVHLSSMYELAMKNELFYTCHQLIENHTQPAIAWYGIACYYHLIQNSEMTQKAFNKSTTLDPKLGAAWLGFGHYFASKGEHDQAMSAYRTASRLLTGLHLPLLCIGMELIGVHNLNLAEQYLAQAKDICPYDPLVYNEMGVIAYKNNTFGNAIQFFLKSLEIATKNSALSSLSNNNNNINNNSSLLSSSSSSMSAIARRQQQPRYTVAMEATLFNLAHSYRKTRQFDKAVHYYRIAQTLSPNNASIFTALGFTHHLQGQFEEAIDLYHQSLSIRDDSFTNTLLNKALSLSILGHD